MGEGAALGGRGVVGHPPSLAGSDAGGQSPWRAPSLLTVGHGTLPEAAFLSLLSAAGVEGVVDVRTAPGSRRHPHFGRSAMAGWLPGGGVSYRWEPALGGWRRPRPDSGNAGLRNASFRGYADHMETGEFRDGLRRLLDEAATRRLAVMCSESVWWRCHRRLLADAWVLVLGGDVAHLGHDGSLSPHAVTPGARRAADMLAYPPV